MVLRLGRLDRECQAHGFCHCQERRKARIAARRKGAVEAFPLDACRLGDLGNAPALRQRAAGRPTTRRGSSLSSIAALRYSAANARFFRSLLTITASCETLAQRH